MCIQGIVSQSEETKLLNSFISSAQSDSSGVSKIIGIPSKRTSCIKRRKKSIPISPCRCCRDGLLWSRVLSWSHSGVYRADSRNLPLRQTPQTPCHTHSLYHSLLYTCGRYQANSNARLVIHPVNDMSQLPELVSHIATLPGCVLYDSHHIVRLAQYKINGFSDLVQTLFHGNLIQMAARMKIQ